MYFVMLAVLLLATSTANAAPPKDTPSVKVVSAGYVCNAYDGLASTCYDLEVTCENLPMRTATMKVSRPPAGVDVIGNILFTTGNSGSSFYSDSTLQMSPNPNLAGARGTVRRLRDAGYIGFELKWTGADGFVTGGEGAGFSRLMCGPAKILDWLQHRSDLTQSDAPTCATGNSAGGMQIASMLAIDRTGRHFMDYHAPTQRGLHTVVYSGGPSFSEQYGICFDDLYDINSDTGRGIESHHPGRVMIDKTNGWYGNGDYCANYRDASGAIVGVLPPDVEIAKMKGTALVSTGHNGDFTYAEPRDYDTVARQFTVVSGNTDGMGGPMHFLGADPTGAHLEAAIYNDLLVGVNAGAIAAQHFNQAIGAIPHGTDNTPQGSAKIVSLMLQHCRHE